MKNILHAPTALSVCAAAALAACGSATQFPNPAAQTPLGNTDRTTLPSYVMPQHVRSDASRTEILDGSAKRACKQYDDGYETSFHAQGKATGPYSGTFVAKGKWGEGFYFIGSHQEFGWSFDESFTISSGTSNLSGRVDASGKGVAPTGLLCKVVKNVVIPQTSSSSGADIKIIDRGKFREKIYGL